MTGAADFVDAFLDSTYLKLDEGALAFIFTKERVKQAQALPLEKAKALVAANRDELAKIYSGVARRILKDAFYMNLFVELAELPDDIAFAFMNLCLRRVEDEQVEAARREVVSKIAAQRKKAPPPMDDDHGKKH
ncbi:MAG: hypothetical protein IT462_00145 [Planctomycetes bacterium]|nr:hypothetical protein [Planctomycetota bacterium]